MLKSPIQVQNVHPVLSCFQWFCSLDWLINSTVKILDCPFHHWIIDEKFLCTNHLTFQRLNFYIKFNYKPSMLIVRIQHFTSIWSLCTDDLVQKNDETSTTKPFSSENETPSKKNSQGNTIHSLKYWSINDLINPSTVKRHDEIQYSNCFILTISNILLYPVINNER